MLHKRGSVPASTTLPISYNEVNSGSCIDYTREYTNTALRKTKIKQTAHYNEYKYFHHSRIIIISYKQGWQFAQILYS
jgi:hypothetical protein